MLRTRAVRTGLSKAAAALLVVAALSVTPPGFAAADRWSSPVQVIADPAVSAATDPISVAVTSRGREVALLVDEGTRSLLVASRRAGERSWTEPVALSVGARWLEDLQLLAWGDGRATVIWTTGVQPRIFTASMATNGGWGSPRRVDIPALPAVFSLRAARSENGTLAIAWNQGEGTGAAAAVHRPGEPWTMTGVHPLVDSTPTGVVIEHSGAVHVAIYQQTADTKVPAAGSSGGRGVFLLDVNRAGAWGPAHRVGPPAGSDIPLEDYGTYRFSSNNDGDILLAWGEYDEQGEPTYIMRVRHAGSGFGPRHVLPRSFGTGMPLAALTASGSVVVGYSSRRSMGTRAPAFLQRRTAAGTWLAPRLVMAAPHTDYAPVRLAIGPGGAALVTVVDITNTSDRITSVVRCLRSAPCGSSTTFPGMDVGSLLAFGPSGRGMLITGDRSDPVSRRLAPPAD